MYRLLRRRGRYEETPHWSADYVTLYKFLRRPAFRRVEKIRLVIDAPCFDATTSAWGRHPECTRPSRDTCHANARELQVYAFRAHYARPSSRALTYLLLYLRSLETVCLTGLRNVGKEALETLLDTTRQTTTLTLAYCTFTETGRHALLSRLAWAGHTVRWPPRLASLTLCGPSVISIMRTAVRVLDDDAPTLPPSLTYLDMHDSMRLLHDTQVVGMLQRLALLGEIVISSDAPRVIGIVEQLFSAKLRIRLFV